MLTLIVSAVVALISGIAGCYAGYRWGRSVEAKIQAIVSAVQS